jgi:SAM-dependent methyltransferase
MPTESRHDRNLAAAFDGQAPLFEKAPVQTDPGALGRLIARAGFGAEDRVIDAGCGPGLVAEAVLEGSARKVLGIDLSPGMVDRARKRCERFGDKAEFRVGSIYDDAGTFDGAISRFVLHHVEDPARFVRRLAELVRPGGVVAICDHVADPDPAARAWHQEIELLRDTTHTANLPPGAIVDLFMAAGLEDLSLTEEVFCLDFDEWFDRGTPAVGKDECRKRLLSGTAQSFEPSVRADGGIQIRARHATIRGVKP